MVGRIKLIDELIVRERQPPNDQLFTATTTFNPLFFVQEMMLCQSVHVLKDPTTAATLVSSICAITASIHELLTGFKNHNR